MKRSIWFPLLAFSLAGCSPSSENGEESVGSESVRPSSENPIPPSAGNSFDPALRPNALQEVASAPTVRKIKAESDSADAPAERAINDVTGREATLAADLLKAPLEELQSLALTELIERWVTTDPEAAWNFRHSLGDDVEAQRAFYRGIMPYLATQDPEIVLETIEAGNWWPGQFESERTAMLEVAKHDFERAVSHFSNTKIGMQTKEVSYLFTSRLASEQSLESALTFAEGVKKPIAKAWATRAAVGHWIESDSFAASLYVNTLEDPLIRSHAVLGLIDGIWQSNPRDSITWAQTIDDSDLRQSTLSKLAYSWTLRGEAKNANAVLNAPGLTAAERRAIEEALSAARTDP